MDERISYTPADDEVQKSPSPEEEPGKVEGIPVRIEPGGFTTKPQRNIKNRRSLSEQVPPGQRPLLPAIPKRAR